MILLIVSHAFSLFYTSVLYRTYNYMVIFLRCKFPAFHECNNNYTKFIMSCCIIKVPIVGRYCRMCGGRQLCLNPYFSKKGLKPHLLNLRDPIRSKALQSVHVAANIEVSRGRAWAVLKYTANNKRSARLRV